MAFTYADILQYIKDNDRADSSARATRNYGRLINDANLALHSAGDWDFDRAPVRVTAAARKNAGTVSVAAAGTAVTGVGTDFQTADIGKYIRFNAEAHQYRVTARTDATHCAVEGYQGASALAAVAYELTNERVALPVRVRKLEELDDGLNHLLADVELQEILYERLHGKSVGTADRWAPEFYQDPAGAAGVRPVLYVWLYPIPLDQTVLQGLAYLWPIEMTDNAHLPGLPDQADGVLREYLLAYLYRDQGKMQEYMAQKSFAAQAAAHELAQFRVRTRHDQRQMWSPEFEGVGQHLIRRNLDAAAGQTF
jgi:hypothetical protein